MKILIFLTIFVLFFYNCNAKMNFNNTIRSISYAFETENGQKSSCTNSAFSQLTVPYLSYEVAPIVYESSLEQCDQLNTTWEYSSDKKYIIFHFEILGGSNPTTFYKCSILLESVLGGYGSCYDYLGTSGNLYIYVQGIDTCPGQNTACGDGCCTYPYYCDFLKSNCNAPIQQCGNCI
eukprot:TRINITY_DN42_c1_g2_i1.p1 TRINITY_DN42_c1_g2~~TRINITY_DN42_c1_g2_i1.p1  ORF type:complete len:178 (-),score=22.82 TRINITY_DN42_c1_g2_i1:61-594(-)